MTESALARSATGPARSHVALPGDGAGVTVALLDGPVDASHPYLGGRVTAVQATGAVTPALARTAPRSRESSSATAARRACAASPRRRACSRSRCSHSARTGRCRAPPPISSPASSRPPIRTATTTSRIARGSSLAPLAAPFAGFADSPEARAIAGISQLGAVVVAAAGNDGPTGTSTGTIASPAAAPDALAVGATDGARALPIVPLTVHGAVETSAQALALGGALAPQADAPLALHAVGAATRHAAGSAVADYRREERGPRRAVLVPRDGGDLAAKARAAAAAGVRVLVVYGADALPAGALGIDDRVPIPIVGVDAALGRDLAHALESRAQVQRPFGQAGYAPNPDRGQVAASPRRARSMPAT